MTSILRDVQVIETLRSSSFDSISAYEEVIDNSLQAGADTIHLIAEFATRDGQAVNNVNVQQWQRQRPHANITKLIFVDNGCGMTPEILQQCLRLGFSERYGQRDGIGRFGVGMTLGAIHECKKVTVVSKTSASDKWRTVYFDIDEMIENKQAVIHDVEELRDTQILGLINKFNLDHGTFVVWEKHDQKNPSAWRLMPEVYETFGRVFRNFIFGKISGVPGEEPKKVDIFVNGVKVFPIDPLYIETDGTAFPDDPIAEEINFEPIEVEVPQEDRDWASNNKVKLPESSSVKIRMSLLPNELRPYRGAGGGTEAKIRKIDKNEGISILRHGREVGYRIIPELHLGKEPIDRFIGCEISFGPELDHMFKVTNIKTGAKPIKEMLDIILDSAPFKQTIDTLRKRIKDYWSLNPRVKGESEEDAVEASMDYGQRLSNANEALNGTSTLPELSTQEICKVKELLSFPGLIVSKVESLEQAIQDQLITTIDYNGSTSNELYETHHIGSRTVILKNKSHPFNEKIVQAFEGLACSFENEHENSLLELNDLEFLFDSLQLTISEVLNNNFDEASLEQFYAELGLRLKQLIESDKED